MEMQYRGKNIKDMDKKELIKVIEHLAAEMNDYKESSHKLSDFANDVFMSMKPRQARKWADKYVRANK